MIPLRPVAAITGGLWIVYAAVRLTGPTYWAPVTILDYVAVVMWSAAMLALALCLWPLADEGAARIVARIGSVGAITNSAANLLDDLFRLRLFGSGFVVSALVILIALVVLAVLLFRSGARSYAAVALLTVLGLALVDVGGAAVVGATWSAVALRWPPGLRAGARNAFGTHRV